MTRAKLFLHARYDQTEDFGSFGYHLESPEGEFTGNECYDNTSDLRLEILACLAGLNAAVLYFKRPIEVAICTKEPQLYIPLGKSRTGDEDLQMQVRGFNRFLNMRFPRVGHEAMPGLRMAENASAEAYHKTPRRQDKEESSAPGSVKPLF